MDKAVSFARIAREFALVGFLAFMCVLGWTAVQAWVDTAQQAQKTMQSLAPTIQHVSTATDVWAKASQKQADAADALIRDLRVLSWHTDRSFLKLDTVLDTADSQLEHAGPVLDSIRTATDAVPGAIDHLNATADASTAAIRAIQGDADDIHARITDKRVDELVESFRGISRSGDLLMADAAYKGHQLLHPDKVKLTFWTGVEGTVKWIHSNVIPPLF